MTDKPPQILKTPADDQKKQTWISLFVGNFPLGKFIRSGVIPLLIFYIFHRHGRPLVGAVLAGSWGLAVVGAVYLRSRKIDIIAVLAAIMAVIQIIITIITNSPFFYLASAAIERAAYGLVFLSSIAISRPLLQLLAEDTMGPDRFDNDFRQTRQYKKAWIILTAVWGGAFLLMALVLVPAQLYLSMEAFLTLRLLSGWPIITTLIAFSFWFPGWYWLRGTEGA